MTLKVGDKVRFTSNYIGARKGDTGTVIELSEQGNPEFNCAQVRLDKNGDTPYPYAHRLEKVERPKPKFKVGDRVRFTEDYMLPDCPKGTQGTVVAARPSYSAPGVQMVKVRKDGQERGGREAYSYRLEKIEHDFKVGDRAIDRFGGGVVTVTEVRDSSVPIRARFKDGSYGLRMESELTKIEDRGFPLRHCDEVKNLDTGREGVVIGDMVHDKNPPFCQPVPAKALDEYEEHRPGTYEITYRKQAQPW